jgi:GNAT superfamily N-acetyltransferase
MIEILPFHPATASSAFWRGYHDYRRVRAAEDMPGEPVVSDAEAESGVRHQWPLSDTRRMLALCRGEIVGDLGYSFRREGTEAYESHAPFVHAWGGVRQSHRRQGIATALLRPLLDFMVAQGKTVVTIGSHLAEGHAFLTARGAVAKHHMIENRLDFAALDWDALAAWQRAPAAAGLVWEQHATRVPEQRLVELQPALSALLGDVPKGTLDLPPLRFELAAIRSWYAEMDRRGGAHMMVLLKQGSEVAGVSDASWDARFPDRVFQNLTAVAPRWRGQGLGRALKAALLLLVHARHPQVRLMTTGNAEVNARMLAINRRLGFAAHRREVTYQISRDALAQRLVR